MSANNPVSATSSMGSSTSSNTGGDQATTSRPLNQSLATSEPKDTQVKDVSDAKPIGSPEAQQLQTSLPQTASTSEGVMSLLTQPVQQQHNSTSSIGQASSPDAATLSASTIKQIVDSAHLLVNNSNNASMSIQLKPESLGELKLVVQVAHGVISANFIAQSQATANLIAAKLPELKQALNDQGISWQNLNVTSDGSQGSNQQASSQSQQNTEQAQTQYNYGYQDATDSDVQVTTPAAYQWAGAGAFNYIV
jgi:flagellar hook-length control protein FliK